jgi:3-deoxy-D-manno-octulosonic-acid transferase
MARTLYTALLSLLLPLIPLRLWLRGRRQPEYREHWRERFGDYELAGGMPTIWIHAVSVGETRAAQPLVQRLLTEYPAHRILLTHMTPTGRATSGELFGANPRIASAYLPYDYPFAVRRFLDRFSPTVGLIMETELWPNLIAICHARRMPLLLVNGRLSKRSARGYRRLSALTREALGKLAAVGAQTGADAQRLRELGATNVQVTGNLKFDVTPGEAQLALGRRLRERWGARPVLLCASTREGEEALILDALANADGRFLTVIVPRHPQRFGDVAQLIAARGIPFRRRSEDGAIGDDTQVVLGDSMGELFAYYAAADVAFVGGSLLPLGGQNLIEPCALGTPVLIGPHTYNFLEAAEQAIGAGAAMRVSDAHELVAQAQALLADPAVRRTMGDAGRRFASGHAGATARTLDLIARSLAAAG